LYRGVREYAEPRKIAVGDLDDLDIRPVLPGNRLGVGQRNDPDDLTLIHHRVPAMVGTEEMLVGELLKRNIALNVLRMRGHDLPHRNTLEARANLLLSI
jgi:hypothetical protein